MQLAAHTLSLTHTHSVYSLSYMVQYRIMQLAVVLRTLSSNEVLCIFLLMETKRSPLWRIIMAWSQSGDLYLALISEKCEFHVRELACQNRVWPYV